MGELGSGGKQHHALQRPAFTVGVRLERIRGEPLHQLQLAAQPLPQFRILMQDVPAHVDVEAENGERVAIVEVEAVTVAAVHRHARARQYLRRLQQQSGRRGMAHGHDKARLATGCALFEQDGRVLAAAHRFEHMQVTQGPLRVELL